MALDPTARAEAEALMATFGQHAQQHLVSQIVGALKRGDQARAEEHGIILDAVTSLVEAASPGPA